MATNYIVVAEEPLPLCFPGGFFPRGFHYKRDATSMVDEIKTQGGKARVIPKAQFTPELLKHFQPTTKHKEAS